MRKFFLSVFFLSSLINFCFSQSEKEITINISPTFQQKAIELEKNYSIGTSDTLQFETLRFYLSSFSFYKNENQVFSESNSFHLIDLSAEKTLTIKIKVPELTQFDAIHFNLGVDSATNVTGAMGGDLDPINGMYWTWQSGYINLKLEGKSNLCNTRNREFQFHLGGYTTPNNSMQQVILKTETSQSISIELSLDNFFSETNLSKQNSIMIPGKDAIELSARIAKLFRIIQ